MDGLGDWPAELLARSKSMPWLGDALARAANAEGPVLIIGEPGVEKEPLARSIHNRSCRRAAPFAAFACAGVPESLLESELFGHVRGASPGAYRDKPGVLERTRDGTVFLDNASELTTGSQRLLFAFLDTQLVRRAGADRPHARVSVRLILGTCEDLGAKTTAGNFHSALYERFKPIQLVLPPLRHRPDDIPLLVEYFVAGYSRLYGTVPPVIGVAAMEALQRYTWPGNVSQLQEVIESIVLSAAAGGTVDASGLPSFIGGDSMLRSLA